MPLANAELVIQLVGAAPAKTNDEMSTAEHRYIAALLDGPGRLPSYR